MILLAGEPKHSQKNLSKRHFVHQKSHNDWPGPPLWQPGDKPLEQWKWRAKEEWYWQGDRNTHRKTCPSATLSTTNPTVTDTAFVVRGRRLTTWSVTRARNA
jgi:hypothetical protein